MQSSRLSGSKADLEALIGKPVDIFAFPYGDFDDAVVDPAKVATTPRDSLLDFLAQGARRV